MKLLITGAAGQVGEALTRHAQTLGEIVAVDRTKADLSDSAATAELLHAEQPDIVINTAAYTAVDKAETERELAFAVNSHLPQRLADWCASHNAALIHYSTDYVFDGAKRTPWLETDSVNPLSAYGETKLAGERAIAQADCAHLVLRTSWVYAPRGKNFLLTMLKLGAERDRLTIVDDQIGAPTAAEYLARQTVAVIKQAIASGDPARFIKQRRGIYHLTMSGETSWCGFARAVFERAAALGLGTKTPQIVPIPTSAYPTPAKRPAYSVLSNAKFMETFGLAQAPWQSGLDETLAAMKR